MAVGQTSQASAVDLVDQAVRTAPDSVAVRAPDGDLTYAELARRAEELAR
jgi:acyl-CoA synthetase (AMP-forming)/AMP-acid ligase II